MGIAGRAWGLLALVWLGLRELPRSAWALTFMALRQRRPHRDAVRAVRRALRSAAGPPRLIPLEPGLYQVPAALLTGPDAGPGPAPVDGPTVLHLLGTGENRLSPLPGLRRLCTADPRLAGCRHVIVDTPDAAAAYLGAEQFAARVRERIRPELDRNPDGLVFAGLSRGALAALELGGSLAQEQGVPVAVVALAAPLCSPAAPPRSIRLIGALEAGTQALVRQIGRVPGVRLWADAVLRSNYLRLCGFLLAELDMDDDEAIDHMGRYLRHTDMRATTLRAVREFGMLGRVSDAELRHMVSMASRRMAATPRLHATLAWGDQDVWVDWRPAMQRARDAGERAGVPPERVQLHCVPGWNHGLGRQADQDYAPLAGWLWRACCHVRPAAAQPTHEASA